MLYYLRTMTLCRRYGLPIILERVVT